MRPGIALCLFVLSLPLTARAQVSTMPAPTPEAALAAFVAAIAAHDGGALLASADTALAQGIARLLGRPHMQRQLPDSLRGLAPGALVAQVLRTERTLGGMLLGGMGSAPSDSLRIEVLGTVRDGADRAFIVARLRGMAEPPGANVDFLAALAGGSTGSATDARLFSMRRLADGRWTVDLPPFIAMTLRAAETAPPSPQTRRNKARPGGR